MCRKYETANNPKAILGPVLFWDAGEIDIKRHAEYIIARILDFGDEEDLRKLRALYPDERFVDVIRNRRGLHSMTRRYWSVYFNLSQEDNK